MSEEFGFKNKVTAIMASWVKGRKKEATFVEIFFEQMLKIVGRT